MHELVRRVSENIGISTDTADTALRIVLNFLDRDGPSDKVHELAEKLGLTDFLSAAPSGGGGLFAGLGGLVGGGAMAAFTQLSSAGLDMGEIQGLTREFVDYAREHAGSDLVDDIVGAIPGLEQFV
ncbi:hypothetical protein [Methylobrevis pamukkalensis]|uniref:DUF2267 domain-containing protein n=1 Tax=Methylobrevis pamukkalensis TaxID=1439726 RepID=A0A1E3H7V2_9HYPH|nr:hypothetical protein [Methylobrevis pamukkalensis]ODN71856.1 hypothetical protein A6302_00788 [Methylobrevis pamukkalensis]